MYQLDGWAIAGIVLVVLLAFWAAFDIHRFDNAIRPRRNRQHARNR